MNGRKCIELTKLTPFTTAKKKTPNLQFVNIITAKELLLN